MFVKNESLHQSLDYKEGNTMNKHDKIFIGFIVIVSIALFFSTGKLVSSVNKDEAQAIVSHKDREVLRINMNKDGLYTVKGDLGDVVIEVLDGKIRVSEEKSPLNYCSIQGWVNKTNVPIVCLPNSIIIVIDQNGQATEEDIIIR